MTAVAGLGVPAVGALSPPGAPELLAPPAGHVFGVADLQSFVVRVTDPDGDRWVGEIEVTETRTGLVTVLATGLADSGDTSDAVAAPPLRPSAYTWRARAVDSTGGVGPWSETRSFTVGDNEPPQPPQLLSPSDGAALQRVGNLPFSISTVDFDNDVVLGTITIRKDDPTHNPIALPTTPAPSGGVSFGVLAQPLTEGTYTWSAEAVDVHGARSPASETRTFTVASPPTAGAGAVAGTVDFGTPGIPSTIGVCEPSAPVFALHSAAVAVNTIPVGYVGEVDLTGNGTSLCESAMFGIGTVTLALDGTSPTESTITCPALSGSYTRVQAALALELTGECRINNRVLTPLTWRVALAFAPLQSTAGLTTRVRQAAVAGALTAAPE